MTIIEIWHTAVNNGYEIPIVHKNLQHTCNT